MTFEPLTAERRRQQTRDYLLQAAARVFADRGYHAATIDEVAAAAGFTKGAVYSNFKGKEDLFLALIESFYARELASLKETYEDSAVPPEARLGDFVNLLGQARNLAPENWGTLSLEFTLYALRNPALRQRLNQLEDSDISAIAELIEDGQARMGIEPEEQPEHAARIVFALFKGLGLMRELAPESVSPDLMAEAVIFVVRGLGQLVDQSGDTPRDS
jgi:AcrR family transcriptional regulator